ncbi:hypothetical protein BU17DRAFT_101566 [Hysterangium stoloniferum]|nr:hypothetical protein BU17DRAFT_101566 [Hysterangium stoloniferum]
MAYLRKFFKPDSDFSCDSTQVPAPLEHHPTPSYPPSGLSHLACYDSTGISSPAGHLGHFSHMPADMWGLDHARTDMSESGEIKYLGVNQCASHLTGFCGSMVTAHPEYAPETLIAILHNGMNDNARDDHPKSSKLSRTYRDDPIRRHGSRQGSARASITATRSARASITAARETRPPEAFSQTSGLAIGHGDMQQPATSAIPGNFDFSIMRNESRSALPLLQGSPAASVGHTQGNVPSSWGLHRDFILPLPPHSTDGGSPTSWTPPLSLDISSTLLHPSRGREIFWPPGDDGMENEVSPGEIPLRSRPYGTPHGKCRGCPWGVRYGVNGEEFPCTLTSNDVKYGKVVQHWAWQHVANEASAIRRGIISMDNAQIVDNREKLDGTVFHLGLCPNPQCWNESQMRLWRNKQRAIATHLKTHEECRPFFPGTVSKEEEECQKIDEEGVEGVKVKIAKRTGYKEMGKLLGYVSPLLPKAPDVLPVGGQLFNGRLH